MEACLYIVTDGTQQKQGNTMLKQSCREASPILDSGLNPPSPQTQTEHRPNSNWINIRVANHNIGEALIFVNQI